MTDDNTGAHAPAPEPSSPTNPPVPPRPPTPYPAYGGAQPYGNPAPPPPPGYQHQKPMSNMAVTSLVLGGISFFMWPVAPITGIIGVITGFIGMKQTKEPHGTHRGWGMALGGTLASAGMFLVSLALAGVMVFVFVLAKDQADRMEERRNEREAGRDKVEQDLGFLASRLQLYYYANEHSFAPGGPIVSSGEAEYPEDAPRVEVVLRVESLARPNDLSNALASYRLEITGKSSAEITHEGTGMRLTVDDMETRSWTIYKGLSGGK